MYKNNCFYKIIYKAAIFSMMFISQCVVAMVTVKDQPIKPFLPMRKAISPSLKNIIEKEKTIVSLVSLKLVEEKVEELIQTKKINLKPLEMYVYDKNTGLGSIFESYLIDQSTTLKNLLGDSRGGSPVAPVDYSHDTIQKVHDILKACESFANTPEGKQKCNALIKQKVEQFNFSSLVSVFNFANNLDIDEVILNPIIKNIEENTKAIFNGNEQLINEYCPILRSVDGDALSPVIRDQWSILLQKIKFFVAKNNKDSSSKKSFFVENWDNQGISANVSPYYSSSIDDMVFSPDGKRLLIKGKGSDIVDFPLYIINSDGTGLNHLEDSVDISPVWIDHNVIAYFKRSIAPVNSLKTFDFISGGYTDIDIKRPQGGIFTPSLMQLTPDKKLMGFYQPFYSDTPFFVVKCDPRTKETIAIDNNPLFRLFPNVATIFFNHNQQSFFSLVRSVSGDGLFNIEILRNEGQNVIEVKSIDQASGVQAISFSGDKIALAVKKNNVVMYLLDNQSTFEYMGKNEILSLKFSRDGKMLLVGCNNELIILSIITGEKIGSFTSNQVFSINSAIDLSSDGNILAVGSRCGLLDDMCFWQKKSNVMIWQLVPQNHQAAFRKLEEKIPSIDQVGLLALLYARAQKGEKPMRLTDDQKKIFQQMDSEVQKMLIDVQYVAPGQLEKKEVKQAVGNSAENNVVDPIAPRESFIRRIINNPRVAAQDFWDYLNKMILTLPQSG